MRFLDYCQIQLQVANRNGAAMTILVSCSLQSSSHLVWMQAIISTWMVFWWESFDDDDDDKIDKQI